jgi:hypothetical protein
MCSKCPLIVKLKNCSLEIVSLNKTIYIKQNLDNRRYDGIFYNIYKFNNIAISYIPRVNIMVYDMNLRTYSDKLYNLMK